MRAPRCHDEMSPVARARPERHANIELSSSQACGVRQDATQPDERHSEACDTEGSEQAETESFRRD